MIYLGIDWGLKRVGLSISEGLIASPLVSLNISGLEDGVNKVMELVKKEGIDVIVIGKPEGEMGRRVDQTVKALTKAGGSVVLADETLSTQNAKKEMIKLGLGKKARQDDNAVAAAIILQNFLDEKEGS